MTEGNFVDYVRLNVASGKGGKGLLISEKSMLPRVDLWWRWCRRAYNFKECNSGHCII